MAQRTQIRSCTGYRSECSNWRIVFKPNACGTGPARVCAADEITAYGSRLSFPTTLAPRHWLANFEEAQTKRSRRNSQSSELGTGKTSGTPALSEDVQLVPHVAQSVLRLRWTICSRPQPSRPLRKAFSKRQIDRSGKITANHRWHREHR